MTAAKAAATGSEALVRIAGVGKRFALRGGKAVDALRGIDLEVVAGEVVGLVGPDGAGKTTLLRCVAGLLEPSAGRVEVLGLDAVRETVGVRSRIGYMPQKFGLYQDLSVQENLDLCADLQGVPGAARAARYERLMRMTGLAPFTRRLAGRLSGGMKQKLGLACALIKQPEVLVLDEPTVGVDPVSRRELWAIIGELVAEEHVGVLVSTAYLDEAERCDRVAVIFDGEIAAVDTPAHFRARLVGQVYRAACATQRAARNLQARAVAREGVADATVRSGQVRVVTERGDGDVAAGLGEELGATLIPAEPQFEDVFMHMAYARRGANAARLGNGGAADESAAPVDRNAVVVEVRDLVKRFGAFEAVKHVSFDVHAGEVFGLLGPNGAGKSTTFRMLCGLLSVSGGEVRVAGHDLRRASGRARARLGYMAQQFSLYGQLSVAENLRFFGQAYGLRHARLRERIDWAYEKFGLGARRDDAAGTLPGGYKQRLAMAAATLHEPEILFLDEPTSGVDPLARREFWRRINGFAEAGVTVIVTTHFMEEAEYCDRMLIMVQGAPLALGTPGEIRGLVRDAGQPDPSIEDGFIALAEGRAAPRGEAA